MSISSKVNVMASLEFELFTKMSQYSTLTTATDTSIYYNHNIVRVYE